MSSGDNGSSSSSIGGGTIGFKIGQSWGVYTEAGYQKELGGGDFKAIQYNISLFSEADDGLLKGLGL